MKLKNVTWVGIVDTKTHMIALFTANIKPIAKNLNHFLITIYIKYHLGNLIVFFFLYFYHIPKLLAYLPTYIE